MNNYGSKLLAGLEQRRMRQFLGMNGIPAPQQKKYQHPIVPAKAPQSFAESFDFGAAVRAEMDKLGVK